MSEQMTRVTDVVDLLNKVCFVQYNTGWSSTSLAKDAIAEITRLRQLLSEADKREKETRATALEEAAAYHLAKMTLFQKTSETAIVPSTIERAKLAIVFHEASAAAIRALQSEER